MYPSGSGRKLGCPRLCYKQTAGKGHFGIGGNRSRGSMGAPRRCAGLMAGLCRTTRWPSACRRCWCPGRSLSLGSCPRKCPRTSGALVIGVTSEKEIEARLVENEMMAVTHQLGPESTPTHRGPKHRTVLSRSSGGHKLKRTGSREGFFLPLPASGGPECSLLRDISLKSLPVSLWVLSLVKTLSLGLVPSPPPQSTMSSSPSLPYLHLQKSCFQIRSHCEDSGGDVVWGE